MELRTLQILCVSGDPARTCLVKLPEGAAIHPVYEMRIVPSIRDSYEALVSQYVDWDLLNLEMPGTRGLKTLGKFRRTNRRRSVIVLVEVNLNSVTHHTLERGAQDYLIKDDLCEASMTRAISYVIQRQASRAENKPLLGLVRVNESLLQRKNKQIRNLYETAHGFIDNLSHEFRAPLTVVKKYVCLIREGTLGQVNNEQAMFLRIAEDREEDLSTMVDDMLDISKLEAGFLAAHRRPNGFDDLTRRIFASLQRKAEIQQLALSFDIEPGFPNVFCDSEKIQGVLINLPVNAMKYTPPGGRVHIWAQRRSKELLVGVYDNGTGIAAENFETIFERFAQGNVDVWSSTKEFGLGLSIAKELVELYLGQMSVKSDVGEGNTFTFKIPNNEPIEVTQRFLRLLDREDLRFLSILGCEVDAALFNGAAGEIEGFLRHLIRGNYLCHAINLQTWLIWISERISEAELFVDRAQRKRENVNANRPSPHCRRSILRRRKAGATARNTSPKFSNTCTGMLGNQFFLFPSQVCPLIKWL